MSVPAELGCDKNGLCPGGLITMRHQSLGPGRPCPVLYCGSAVDAKEVFLLALTFLVPSVLARPSSGFEGGESW